jgi:hypothetical protein
MIDLSGTIPSDRRGTSCLPSMYLHMLLNIICGIKGLIERTYFLMEIENTGKWKKSENVFSYQKTRYAHI